MRKNTSNFSNLPKTRCFVLNNGLSIPSVGLGTGMVQITSWRSLFKDAFFKKLDQTRNAYKLYKVLKESVEFDCHLYDTSRAYGLSEKILGLSLSSVNNKDKFIITKISNSDQENGNIRESVLSSIENLKLTTLDLLLLHWPKPNTYLDCWKKMEDLYEEGLVNAIGVSNFNIHHLEKLLSISRIKPAVNEFERHPLFNQKSLVEYCNKYNINVIAYTPLGRMHQKLKENKKLNSICTKHNKTIPQIILRWNYQQNVISIPHTKNIYHLAELFNIFDFVLSHDDIYFIDQINIGMRLRYDPDNCRFTK